MGIPRVVRRIPPGPAAIAAAMIAALCLVNVLDAPSAEDPPRRGAPEARLPAQVPASELPSVAGPVARPGAPAPDATITVTQTVLVPAPGVTRTVTAPGSSAPRGGAPAEVANSGAPYASSPAAGDAPRTTRGDDGDADAGSDASTDPDGRLRVTGLVVGSDRTAGEKVRCGRDEVVVSGTVIVDGGEGWVVHQWLFDGVRSWTPDLLHFTGSGPRQLTVQIPWPVPQRDSGARVRASVTMRILQPVLEARTSTLVIEVVCR